jgi:UDP-N-acetylmuramoyl-tripeptide--D-alanyl-D-alanine ligase
MKASLDVLKYGLHRKVAILGDMGELGPQEGQLHYEVGAYGAKAGIDVLICVGKLSAEMKRGAQDAVSAGAGPLKILYFPTKEALLPELPELLEEGDTILVKASHFMGFSEIVKFLS